MTIARLDHARTRLRDCARDRRQLEVFMERDAVIRLALAGARSGRTRTPRCPRRSEAPLGAVRQRAEIGRFQDTIAIRRRAVAQAPIDESRSVVGNERCILLAHLSLTETLPSGHDDLAVSSAQPVTASHDERRAYERDQGSELGAALHA